MRTAALFISIVLATTAQADFTGRVVGITDGDTVRVMRGGEAVKIRLHGIDAPESRQAFGSRSKTISVGSHCWQDGDRG